MPVTRTVKPGDATYAHGAGVDEVVEGRSSTRESARRVGGVGAQSNRSAVDGGWVNNAFDRGAALGVVERGTWNVPEVVSEQAANGTIPLKVEWTTPRAARRVRFDQRHDDGKG
jgi:hypothetical protein